MKTRAEQIMEFNKRAAPKATPQMAKQVSQARRETLEDEFEKGMYRDHEAPNYNPADQSYLYKELKDEGVGVTVAGNAISSLNIIQKSAQAALFGSGAGSTGGGAAGAAGNSFRGAGGTTRQVPEVYSPLWLNSNLNLPRDRATVNAWCRSFFALNPLVHNAITLHSTYPIAKLNIKCKDPEKERFYAEMAEELDLIGVCVQIAQEYWTLGEAFVYAELDESQAKWSRILLQNPDYITVKRSVIAGEPIISLRPDENLRRVIFSSNPSDIQQRKQLDPAIIEHVRKGQNIPLDNFYVSHLARRISPYEIRGTGLIVPCFRALMLFDKLYESKYAQADNMVNPLTLVKIGSQEFRPSPTDLEQWRDLFASLQYDKDAKIFTHDAINVERVGHAQGIYDIAPDLERLTKLIFTGLMVPSVIMDGSDTTYATGSVALDVLRQRYMQFRSKLSFFLKRKIFAPIAKLNDFYEYRDGKKMLILPEIDWNHMSLFDMSDYISNLATLAQGEGPQKKLSIQTLYRSLGIEYEDEQRKIRYEDVQEAIRRKELMSLDRYPLEELRALGPDDEIREVAEHPVPGETPYEQPSAGGMPGVPGAPPMGGGLGGGIMPPGPPPSPLGGGGRPPGPAPQPPGGGTGIGAGGVPKPPLPA